MLAAPEYNAPRRTIAAFGRAAEQAGKAILYHAGHGVEADGQNYMIPVDAHLAHDRGGQFHRPGWVRSRCEGIKKLHIVRIICIIRTNRPSQRVTI